MGKSKAVQTLLATAIALASTVDNVDLKTAIGELEALEDATHSNGEYKALKDLVEQIEQDAPADKNNGVNDADAQAQAEKEAQDKLDAEQKAKDDAEAEAKAQLEAQAKLDAEKETPKKFDYAGVRMIGSKWYCAKDKYKKGFATANECAEHFNG